MWEEEYDKDGCGRKIMTKGGMGRVWEEDYDNGRGREGVGGRL